MVVVQTVAKSQHNFLWHDLIHKRQIRWGMSVIIQVSKMGKGIFSYLHMGQIQGVYEAEIKLSSQHTIKNFLNGFQLTLKISTTILNMIN